MMREVFRILLVAGLVTSGAGIALAAEAEDESEVMLAPVRISAAFSGEDGLTATPLDLLDGDALFRRGAATLGGTLDGLPGVHADTFGAGSARPVIRGQTAPRVSVLSDGASLLDASAVSPDHAVTVEPMLTQRMEVLRGPATLRYGGGAIGGVINVLDSSVPEQMPEGAATGFAALRGNTVADEKAAAAGVTTRLGTNLALRVEGAQRRANDYQVNGFTQRRVPATYAESDNASLGLSWIGEDGFIGLAYRHREDEYGLPGHSHDYEDCVPVGAQLDCGGGGQHNHEHGEAPYVDLVSRRVEVRGEYRAPLIPGIERIMLRSSHTNYRHHEIDEGEIGTTFRHRGYETRIEAEHQPLAGWEGLVGIQYQDSQFNTFGVEAFIPKTDTRLIGVFLIERYRINEALRLELGARHEHQWLATVDDPQNRPDFSNGATSLSSALLWQPVHGYQLSLSLDRAQRSPHAQEMYARGVHLATNTYECGLAADAFTCGGPQNDAPIRTETSHNIGLNLKRTLGALTFEAGLFHNRIDDYIYARTLDQVDEFRLIKYTQDDAVFNGAELEVRYTWADWLSTRVFGDTVRGALRNDENLPRIPADRLGVGVDTFWRGVEGDVAFYRVFAQDRLAPEESRTAGHDLLSASLGYRFGRADQYSVFLRGNNLLGEKVWNHTSFLAQTVPEPGRNLSAGLRIEF